MNGHHQAIDLVIFIGSGKGEAGMGKKLLMGNEAIGWGAVEAGVRVVTGYPGTPSSEVLATVAQLAGRSGIYVEWSVNEKVALEVAAGASYAGARAMVTMKQVGLNVAADPLMTLAYIGVRGGLVLVVADDPGPHSSQNEQDTRKFAAMAGVPVLDPATPREAREMVPEAFRLSEELQLPVILRPTTRVCHVCQDVEVNEDILPSHNRFYFEKGPGWVIFPSLAAKRHVWINGQQEKARRLLARLPFNRLYDSLSGRAMVPGFLDGPAVKGNLSAFVHRGSDPEKGTRPFAPGQPAAAIIACGVSFNYINEALELMGLDLPVLKIGTPYPLPGEPVLSLLRRADRVLVVEEQEPVVEEQVMLLAFKHRLPVGISGKHDGLVPREGEFNVDRVRASLKAFLQEAGKRQALSAVMPAQAAAALDVATFPDAAGTVSPGDAKVAGSVETGSGEPAGAPPQLPLRPPVLCAGCPHRAAFYAVKQAAAGTDAVFTGDIGCYTLGNAPPLHMVDTCLCMGASVNIAAGLSRVEPERPHIAFLGDSTFFHSGISGLINAVYNKARMVLVVLDNRTTAMTGHQPHPGLGRTALGAQGEPLDIAALAGACGVDLVRVVDPYALDQAEQAVREALAHSGPAVVVMRRECVSLVKRRRAARVNTDKCLDCGQCIAEIGCPAIFPGAESPHITGQCNGCGLCARICPAEAIEVVDL